MLFQPSLWRVKAKLYFKKDARPKFCSARPVPLALCLKGRKKSSNKYLQVSQVFGVSHPVSACLGQSACVATLKYLKVTFISGYLF